MTKPITHEFIIIYWPCLKYIRRETIKKNAIHFQFRPNHVRIQLTRQNSNNKPVLLRNLYLNLYQVDGFTRPNLRNKRKWDNTKASSLEEPSHIPIYCILMLWILWSPASHDMQWISFVYVQYWSVTQDNQRSKILYQHISQPNEFHDNVYYHLIVK